MLCKSWWQSYWRRLRVFDVKLLRQLLFSDRTFKRYFYSNNITGENSWAYPEVDLDTPVNQQSHEAKGTTMTSPYRDALIDESELRYHSATSQVYEARCLELHKKPVWYLLNSDDGAVEVVRSGGWANALYEGPHTSKKKSGGLHGKFWWIVLIINPNS